MTDNTELNEINIPERIPEPWENAPKGLIYYKELYEDGHLGTFTSSPEIAYMRGYFDNSIPEEDLEVSDVDGRTYLKSKCPHKTEQDLLKDQYRLEIQQLKKSLSDTDYKAIKYAEGEINPEEYLPIKKQRAEWRSKINQLQAEFDI